LLFERDADAKHALFSRSGWLAPFLIIYYLYSV
jgi:hypothetical protein